MFLNLIILKIVGFNRLIFLEKIIKELIYKSLLRLDDFIIILKF